MNANNKQVGGEHYRLKDKGIQHWDYCWIRKFDQFQYQITKYVERWKDKNGLQDLIKAQHFLEKYIELVKMGLEDQEIKELQNKKQMEMNPPLERPVKLPGMKIGMFSPFGYNESEEQK